MTQQHLTEDLVYEALEAVKDPEIPVISVVQLGIIKSVAVDGGKVKVQMTPTFAGCPAIDVMKKGIEKAVGELEGVEEIEVEVMYKEPWSSNFVSPEGRKLLKEFGLSPPPAFDGELTMETLQRAECPVCGSRKTSLLNTFGPTACRAVHHCRECKETFEQFKPL